jgi:hypothetical protein
MTETAYGDTITVKAGQDYDSAEKGTAVINSASYNSVTNKGTFVAYLTMPENTVIVKAGLVAVSSNTFDPATQILTADNAEYVKSLASAEGKCGPVLYTWTKGSFNAKAPWYVRAYLVYTDSDGATHTVYGELVKLATD